MKHLRMSIVSCLIRNSKMADCGSIDLRGGPSPRGTAWFLCSLTIVSGPCFEPGIPESAEYNITLTAT
jgi:hypothetical protein